MKGYERAYTLMEEIYKNFSRADKLWFLGENPALMHLRRFIQIPRCPRTKESRREMSRHPKRILCKPRCRRNRPRSTKLARRHQEDDVFFREQRA